MNHEIITFMASFLIWFILAGLAYLWLINGRINKEQALHALFSALVAWSLAQMIKSLFPELRPFEVNNIQPLTVTRPVDPGFPSAHSTAAFAIAVSIWLHDKKIGMIFVLSAIGVGVGRVLGNVHSWGDVIVGGALGSSVAYVFERLHLYALLSGEKVKH